MSIADRFQAMLTRGKFTGSRIAGGRTLVQLAALDNETYADVELLLPPGYVARPISGNQTADPLVLEINGLGSHKIALCGDDTAHSVADLAEGELGLSNASQRVILRLSHTEIIGVLLQWAAAPGGTLQRLVQEQFLALYNAHTHAGGAKPDVPMTAAHLTGGT